MHRRRRSITRIYQFLGKRVNASVESVPQKKKKMADARRQSASIGGNSLRCARGGGL